MLILFEFGSLGFFCEFCNSIFECTDDFTHFIIFVFINVAVCFIICDIRLSFNLHFK